MSEKTFMLNKVVAKTYQIQSKNSYFWREMDKRHSSAQSGHCLGLAGIYQLLEKRSARSRPFDMRNDKSKCKVPRTYVCSTDFAHN